MTEADLAKTLEGLSAAATQGELIIPRRDYLTDRTSAYVSETESSVFMTCMGRPTSQREADTAFLVTLWNAYRTGKLIVVPDDAIRAQPYPECDDYIEVRRDERERMIAALKGADHAG